jgi:hypothetical protein
MTEASRSYADLAARAHGRPVHSRLSDVLHELASDQAPMVSIREIMEALGDRSFGALFILIAAPNLVPLPPGSSFIFSAPLIVLALQLIFGRQTPWLPKRVLDREVDRGIIRRVYEKLGSKLIKLERMLKPRYNLFGAFTADRFIGIVTLLAALILFLPIPLGNMPPAAAIVALGLGLIERDGIAVAAGVALTAASAVIAVVFGGVIAAIAGFAYHYILG